MKLPEPGETFLHRYEVIELLGKGGFASVYRAIDSRARRDVALKVLDPGTTGYSQDVRARFLREVQVLASLRDPHTITMFDFGQTDEGLLFMVFEYVAGRDLEDLLARGRRFGERETVHILRQILQSLHEAHLAGLLHRDIKPANIRVYEYMGDPLRIKLLDFGIARLAEPGGARITRAGGLVGTPQFMAPEQVIGGELTPATDIYSLGLVAFEMLVGQPAVDARTAAEILELQVAGPPLRLPASLPVRPGLRMIVERMTDKRPQDRYQGVAEIVEALDRLGTLSTAHPPAPVSPRPSAPSPTTISEPAHPSTTGPATFHGATDRRRAALLMLAVAAVVIALAALVALLSSGGDDRRSPMMRPSVAPAPEPPSADELVAPPEAPEDVPSAPTEERPYIERDPHLAVASRTASRSIAGALDEALERATGGCVPLEGDVGLRIDVANLPERRKWATYVPRSYDGSERVPVIFLFHDSRAIEPVEFLEETELVEVAEREGFLIVTPRSLTPVLLGPRMGMAWRLPNEVDFARHVVESTLSSFCVDTDQVFAVGHAAGAAFVESLVGEISFRAIATTSYRNLDGEVARWDTSPRPSVPHIQFAGEQDGHNPIDGGPGCSDPAILRSPVRIPLAEREEEGRRTNGCEPKRRLWRRAKDFRCDAWETCDDAFVSCRHSYGHAWPSKRNNPQDYVVDLQCGAGPPMLFDVAEVIWAFFDEVRTRSDK